MTALYEVPLIPANQSFTVSILQKNYVFRLFYCDTPMGGWVLDILDANRDALLTGLPLITGANLLEQFGYLELPFGLVVATDGDFDQVPTFENLGIEAFLYVVI